MSFLTKLKSVGINVEHVALAAFNTLGPVAAPLIGSALGGPVGAGVATKLVQFIADAEAKHLAAGAPPAPTGTVDLRKADVVANFTGLIQKVEAAAEALGFAAPNPTLHAEVPNIVEAFVMLIDSFANVMSGSPATPKTVVQAAGHANPAVGAGTIA